MPHRFLLLLGLLAGFTCFARAQNLLSNGALEGAYVSGVAPEWSDWRIDTRATSAFAESASGRSGKAQLVEVSTMLGGWQGGGPALSAPINPHGTPAGLVAGQDYEASVWLRTDRQGLHKVSVTVDDAKAWQPNAYARVAAVVGPTWTQVLFRFRAATSDASANFSVNLRQEGRLWVDDAQVRLLTAADRALAPVGNLVRNSSFEVGLFGWQNRYTSSSIVADATAPHGGSVLSLSWFGGAGNRFLSHAFPLPWGHTYTVSLWMRATGLSPGATTAVPVRVGGPATSITSSSTALASATFDVGADWARHSFTFTAPPVPGEAAFLIIDPPDGPGLRVDGVQVEAASSAGPYAPRESVEAALDLDRQSGWVGAYAPGEPVTATARLHNAGPNPASFTLRRRTRDVWDAVVPGSLASEVVELPANSSATRQYTFVTAGRTGAFRAEIDVDDAQVSPAADATFAVLPAAPAPGVQAPFGTHLDKDDRTTNPRAAGAGWTKTWSTSWNDLEQTDNVWSYGNASTFLTRWRDAGLKTLAVVGYPPVFAQNRPASGAITYDGSWYPPSSAADATDYARRVADQFGSLVGAWELGNEPDIFLFTASGTTRSQAYPPEALAYATGLRERLPSVPILLGSATTDRSPEEWIANALESPATNASGQTLRDLVTGVTYHNYDPDPATTRRIVQRLRARLSELAIAYDRPALADLEIWDTEWAPVGSPAPFSRHRPRLNATAQTAPDARRSAALVVRGYVARLGEGVAKSFLYQAYGTGSVVEGDHDLGYEIDGSPRPLVPAYAVAAARLADVSQPLALAAPGVWGYRFLRADGRPLYVLWADELQTGSFVNYTTPVAVSATDMMGNVYGAGEYAAGATVPVPPEPIYLLGPSTDLQVLGQGLAIDDNDTTPSAVDGTDFGGAEVAFPEGGVTRVFTLRNLGASTITFTGSPRAQLSGAGAADFAVLGQPPATLAPGASAEIQVAFRPQLGGLRSVSLQIPNSAGGFAMSLAGTGTGALPLLGPLAGSLSVSVRAGEVLDAADVVLSNLARGELTWSASLPARYAAESNRQGQADAPVFDWYDIRAAGQIVQFPFYTPAQDRDDVVSGPVQIGFAFPFHGTSYTSLRISSNGVICFDPHAFIPYSNTTLPSLGAPARSVFVLWDDLYLLANTSQVYTFQPDADTFVVSWLDVAYYSDRGARQSFQVVLKRDGTILTQYATVARSPNSNGFVIGLQNANNNPDEALLYSRTPTPPDNSLAVRFRPPAAALSGSANFTAGKPASWASFTGPASGSLAFNQTLVLPLRFNPENLVVGQTYRSSLTLTTNDPAHPSQVIPLALTVLPMADPEPPVVAITAPASGATAELSATLNLTASASVPRSVISRVEFHANGSMIGQALGSPFTYAWRADTVGAYSVVARAFASNGLSTDSAPVSVTWVRPTVSSSGLVAHWRFDEGSGTTAADLSGNDRTATLAGTTTWSGSGRFGSALLLNGVTHDRAGFTMPSALAYTYSAWIRLDAEGGSSGGRFPRVIETPSGVIVLRRDSTQGTYGAIGFIGVRSGGSNGEWNTAAGLISLNTWYHLAVSYDASSTSNTPAVYLNGVRRNVSVVFAPGGTAVQASGAGLVGNRPDGTRPFAGRIDHFRIYDRALSESEIFALYHEDGGPAAPTAFSATAGASGITLAWTPPAGTGLTYAVLRGGSPSGPFSPLASGLGTTAYLDSSVSPGTTYHYLVRAIAFGVTGPAAGPVSATALSPRRAWRLDHFGTTDATASAADEADPDADGMANLLEYALGGDPLVADASLRLPIASIVASRLRLGFERIADPALTYTVQASNDLVTWTPIWSSTGEQNTAGHVQVDDTETLGAAPRRFLRLRVTAPVL